MSLEASKENNKNWAIHEAWTISSDGSKLSRTSYLSATILVCLKTHAETCAKHDIIVKRTIKHLATYLKQYLLVDD